MSPKFEFIWEAAVALDRFRRIRVYPNATCTVWRIVKGGRHAINLGTMPAHYPDAVPAETYRDQIEDDLPSFSAGVNYTEYLDHALAPIPPQASPGPMLQPANFQA